MDSWKDSLDKDFKVEERSRCRGTMKWTPGIRSPGVVARKPGLSWFRDHQDRGQYSMAGRRARCVEERSCCLVSPGCVGSGQALAWKLGVARLLMSWKERRWNFTVEGERRCMYGSNLVNFSSPILRVGFNA
jgi:hypothetical protein